MFTLHQKRLLVQAFAGLMVDFRAMSIQQGATTTVMAMLGTWILVAAWLSWQLDRKERKLSDTNLQHYAALHLTTQRLLSALEEKGLTHQQPQQPQCMTCDSTTWYTLRNGTRICADCGQPEREQA